MNWIVFTLSIISFIYLNISVPEPQTDLLQQFLQLSLNIKNCNLMENELEKFSYKFMKLINHNEIKEELKKYLKKRKIDQKKNIKVVDNLCKVVINEAVGPNTKSKQKLLKIVCDQVIQTPPLILEDTNLHAVMLWKVYQHLLNVRNAYVNNRTNLMSVVSEEGTYLSEHLFEAKDKCFWSQDYQGICYPSKAELESLMKERYYKQIVRQIIFNNLQFLTQKVKVLENLYGLMKENGVVDKVEFNTIDIYNLTGYSGPEVMLINEFKKEVVPILARRINVVVSKYRSFMKRRSSSGLNFESYLGNTKCIQEEITNNVYLDLKTAFKRCTKKYYYCPCAKVNQASVSFMCNGAPNDEDRQNVTLYSHNCEVLIYKSTKTSVFSFLSFSNNYENGKLPKLEGPIYPWILGDGSNIAES